jgi:hypothetical protein
LVLPYLKVAKEHLQGQKDKNNQKNYMPLFDKAPPLALKKSSQNPEWRDQGEFDSCQIFLSGEPEMTISFC